MTTGSTGHVNRQSNFPTNKPAASFYRPAALPVAQATVSKHWRENITFHGLAPSSPAVFQLCLWPLIAPGYFGGGLPCLSSALWYQYPIKCKYLLTCEFVKLARMWDHGVLVWFESFMITDFVRFELYIFWHVSSSSISFFPKCGLLSGLGSALFLSLAVKVK